MKRLCFIAAFLLGFWQTSVHAADADVFLLRGIADFFSRGLDAIGAELAGRGVPAQVMNHAEWRRAAALIRAHRAALGPRPIVLVGHSLGANDVVRLAAELQRSGIVVDELILLAATDPLTIPANVQRATNYCFERGGWGIKLAQSRAAPRPVENVDCSRWPSFGHFNLDDQPSIQAAIIARVLQTVQRDAQPAATTRPKQRNRAARRS